MPPYGQANPYGGGGYVAPPRMSQQSTGFAGPGSQMMQDYNRNRAPSMTQGYRPSPTGGGMFMQPKQQGGGFWRGLGNALKAPFSGGGTTNNYYGGQQGPPMGQGGAGPMWGGTPYGQGQLPGGYKPPMGSRPDMMPPGSTPSPNMPRNVPSQEMPPWARNPPPWMQDQRMRMPNEQMNQGPPIGPQGNLQDMFARMQQQQPYDPNYQQPDMVNNGWGKMIPREQAEAFRRGGGIA